MYLSIHDSQIPLPLKIHCLSIKKETASTILKIAFFSCLQTLAALKLGHK